MSEALKCPSCGSPKKEEPYIYFPAIGKSGYMPPNWNVSGECADKWHDPSEPAKCPECSAKSDEEASTKCSGDSENCPMNNWLRSWPTQQEFDAHEAEQIRLADLETSALPARPELDKAEGTREKCPTCGTSVPSNRTRSHCAMMCPPINWRWVVDERLSATDEIECADPWHDSSSASGREKGKSG